MEQLTLGNLIVDLEAYRAWIDHREVVLTYLEFEVLAHLARRAGAVVSRQELLQAVWGEQLEGRRLNIQICRLRKKLANSRPWNIRTIRRRGYSLGQSIALAA